MPYNDTISQAINLGRRLNSINRVATRWRITQEEAAELMINVEKQQTEYKLELEKKFKKIYQNQLDPKFLDKSEYRLFIEGNVINLVDNIEVSESNRYRRENSLDILDISNKNNSYIDNVEVFKKNSSESSANSNTELINSRRSLIENIQKTNTSLLKNICCCF